MKIIRSNREYFLAPLITLILMCIVFIIKGVYPFGDRLIPYYDMYPQYIPLYTHTYDILHGDSSIFVNWFNGCSESFMANYAAYCINPTNLLFYFTKRDTIMEFMSFMLIIKYMLSSLTMSIYIKKTYSASLPVNLTISLLYTFSGHNLQYYMNIFFLDIVIMLPLLMLTLDALLKNGKTTGFIITSAICIMLNYYISSMVFIYIIIYSAGVIFFEIKGRKERCRSCANLGIATVIAILISSVLSIPAALKISSSSRAGFNNIPYTKLIMIRSGEFDPQKMFMLFGAELGIAALAITVLFFARNKKPIEGRTKLHIYLIPLLIAPIVFESTNIIWHLGSYAHFPYRFAFILTFTAGDILARYFTLTSEKEQVFIPRFSLLNRFKESASVLVLMFSLIVLGVMAYQMKNEGIVDLDLYVLYKFALIGLILTGILALGICTKKFRVYFLLSASVLQSGIMGWGLIAPGGGSFTSSFPLEMKEEYDLQNDNLSRIKQTSMIVFCNYGMLLGQPTLADWSNDSSADYIDSMRELGYSSNYTYQFDHGGTAFSDALLNIKKAFTLSSLDKYTDKELYTDPVYGTDSILYDCRYTLPFGLLTDEEFIKASDYEPENTFDYQNRLYKALTGSDESLFKVYSFADILDGEECEMNTNVLFNYQFTGTVKLPEKSCLYMWMNYFDPEELNSGDNFKLLETCIEVNVNGQPHYIPYFGDDDKNRYPQKNNTGIVSLGVYDNETVRISAISTNDDPSKIYFGVMDIDKLDALCKAYSDKSAYDVNAGGSELTMKVDDPQGRYVFLPMQYDKNWKAEINGSDAELIPVMNGAFMALKLGDEDADIRLYFSPRILYVCLAVTVIGLALLAALIIARKKGHDPTNIRAVSTAAGIIFALIAAAALLVLFAIPAIAFPVSFFI